MSIPVKTMVNLALPWFDYEGELNYQGATFVFTGRVERRQCKRVVNRWYKEALGRSVRPEVFQRVWRRRHVTGLMSPEKIEEIVNRFIIDAQNNTEAYPASEESPAQEAGEQVRDLQD